MWGFTLRLWGLGFLIASVHHAKSFSFAKLKDELSNMGAVPFPRVKDNITAVKKYLSQNIPVILIDTGVFPEQQDFNATIEHIFANWDSERLSQYYDGSAVGRAAFRMGPDGGKPWVEHPEWTSVNYPYPGALDFNLIEMYGIFGKATLPGRAQISLHRDYHCNHAGAVMFRGAKLFWLAVPAERKRNPDGLNQLNFEWIENMHDANSLIIRNASDYVHYADIVRRGEILIFPYWIGHTGIALDGHSWSFNGQVKLLNDDSLTMQTCHPPYYHDMCKNPFRMNMGTLGILPYPIGPWDKEWQQAVEEMTQLNSEFNLDVMNKYIKKWRVRVCKFGDDPRLKMFINHRDPKCKELTTQEEL